ncbi:MAG: tRNA uridine-5-carboxymethylaminomethyl(34) synthesis GTPase MnmE, partial [Bacillota bacterium]|nr:tRNA uridine-5-carboxymethylaminomethyl(34) synthesis GTPase MnmE [Bacillota bacterium]
MEDTIAAVATAYGEGGIGIIRISGENALPVLHEVFEPADGASDLISRRMTYGRIVDRDNDRLIDEVLAVYMKGPKTYTAEDVVEINCHGSMVSLRKTLALVLRKGVRLAEPGEFTKRAFLNG